MERSLADNLKESAGADDQKSVHAAEHIEASLTMIDYRCHCLYIIMFHCFSSQSVKLSKPNPGKVIHLLPLDNNTIVTLDDSNSLVQYRLSTGGIITHILLHFKPRKIVAINNDSILALSPEDRRLY